jgi:hypothetical protein
MGRAGLGFGSPHIVDHGIPYSGCFYSFPTVDSGAKCNGSRRSGFGRLCQASFRIAWNGVLNPRHFLGVRLALRTMSWISIAPLWFTSAKHGFRVIDLAEMLCFMADRIPAISHTEELIVATARSIAGHTLRYGGLHASNLDRRASLLYVPDSAVVLGRAPGASGRRRRGGATDIQQHMPNLPYDQGRRQSPRSEPPQHHRKESRLAAKLRLFQRYEGRGLRVGHGKARQLHRETR